MSSKSLKLITPIVVTISGLLAIWQFVIPSAKDLLDFKNRVTFAIDRVFDFKYTGGLFGSFNFSVDIKATNPTNSEVLLKKPYIKAYINGKYIGDTEPSSENITVEKNANTIFPNLHVKIPLANIGSLIPILDKLKSGEHTDNTLQLDILTEVNGLPVEKQLQYDI